MKSFKELLEKIANTQDPMLGLYVSLYSPDEIADLTYEVLHKADKESNRAIKPTFVDTAKNYSPDFHGEMFYDALSHHASHYKDAIEKQAKLAGQPGSAQLAADSERKRANKHMAQIFHLVNVGKHVGKALNDVGSEHKLDIEAVHPSPWQTANNIANKSERAKTPAAARGWDHNGPANFRFVDTASNPRAAAPDYGFLQKDAHPTHKDVAVHGHVGAYPLEDIKVNGRNIDIHPVEHEGRELAVHPFDHHPLFDPKYHDSHMSNEKMESFLNDVDKFNESPSTTDFVDKHIERMGAPDYQDRGKNKSPQVHTGTRIDKNAAKNSPVGTSAHSEVRSSTAAPLSSGTDYGFLDDILKDLK